MLYFAEFRSFAACNGNFERFSRFMHEKVLDEIADMCVKQLGATGHIDLANITRETDRKMRFMGERRQLHDVYVGSAFAYFREQKSTEEKGISKKT
eukprot:5644127-Amphidinium_carterae.1